MICPNCNIKLKNDICLKCGYMKNGNKIRQYESKDKYVYERLFNKNFDKMYRNQNSYIPMIIGGTYVSYKGYLVIGIIINIIEFIIFNIITRTLSGIPLLMLIYPLFVIIIFIFERLLLGATENSLCLFLDRIKINYIMKKKNFERLLEKHKSNHIFYLIINIIACIYFYQKLLSY